MTRIAALVLLVGVLVATGFWLARDRGGEPAAGSAAAAGASTSAEAQDAVGGSRDADDGPAAASSAPAAAAPSQAEPAPAAESAGEPASQAADGAQADAGAASAETADGALGVGVETPAEAGGDMAYSLPEGFTVVPFQAAEPQQVFDAARQVLQPGLDYLAVLRTNRGDMLVDLFEDQTPVTVNNFVFLALQRYFQGVPFHRVLDGFMAQTGDPTGSGRGGPGYVFDDEIVPSLSFDAAGLVAMANAGPGTNGSQFFITFAPTPWLDGNHTIFGRLLAGQDVLDAITRIDPQTPSAVAAFDDSVAALAEQGVVLPGDPSRTVAAALEEVLGTVPLAGQSFTVAGYRGAVGQLGGQPAFGFFPHPDVLEEVVIATAPKP